MGPCVVEINRIVIREVQYQFEVNRCRNEEIIVKGKFGWAWPLWAGRPRVVLSVILTFDENEKKNQSVMGQTEYKSTREKVDVKMGSDTSTLESTIYKDFTEKKQQGDTENTTGSGRLKITSLSQEYEELKREVKDLVTQLQRSKPASKQDLDVVKEQQIKADHDELDETLNRFGLKYKLTNRLSAFTANQLTKDNTQIADLSDQCRPTKPAEWFTQLYENQWTDVFEILDKNEKEEREIINIISDTIKQADIFCEKEKTDMTERILVCVAYEINNQNRSAIDRSQNSSQASKFTGMEETKQAAERYIKCMMKALALQSSQHTAK
ncbi:hypothetical protein DPMN_108296, partial [Dreissena polymorpha]